MKKRLKIIATFILCFSIMANCLPAQASTLTCYHNVKCIVERRLVYGREAGNHIVTLLSNNMKAACYDYEYSYEEKWCCQDCGAYLYETRTYTEHSLAGLY